MEDILNSVNARSIAESAWDALKANLKPRHAYLTTIYPEVLKRIIATLKNETPPLIENSEEEAIIATANEILEIIRSRVSQHYLFEFISQFEQAGLDVAKENPMMPFAAQDN